MNQIITLLSAVIGVAIIAVVLSNRAQTARVISAGASGFASVLNAALSPVTGGPVSGLQFNSGDAFRG
jgi:uncharacterized membrane-anchored protein YitT (DUF2179 family)